MQNEIDAKIAGAKSPQNEIDAILERLRKELKDFEFHAKEARKEAKMQKALARNPQIIAKETDEKTAEKLKKRIVNGKSVTKQNAQFIFDKITEKDFLVKKQHLNLVISNIFGTTLYRILSNKQYILKRSAAFWQDDELKLVSKWKKSINPIHSSRTSAGLFVQEINPYDKQDSDKWHEFIKGFARLMAVEMIIGEHDWNPQNYFYYKKINSQTNEIESIRPVAIDKTPFLGLESRDLDQSSFCGSALSKDFLEIFLDESQKRRLSVYDASETIARMNKEIEKTEQALKAQEISIDKMSQKANETPEGKYSEAIRISIKNSDYILREANALLKSQKNLKSLILKDSLQKAAKVNDPEKTLKYILEKIMPCKEGGSEGNPHKIDYLIEFIDGLKDAIKLAKNEDFLNQYCQTFAKLDRNDIESKFTKHLDEYFFDTARLANSCDDEQDLQKTENEALDSYWKKQKENLDLDLENQITKKFEEHFNDELINKFVDKFLRNLQQKSTQETLSKEETEKEFNKYFDENFPDEFRKQNPQAAQNPGQNYIAIAQKMKQKFQSNAQKIETEFASFLDPNLYENLKKAQKNFVKNMPRIQTFGSQIPAAEEGASASVSSSSSASTLTPAQFTSTDDETKDPQQPQAVARKPQAKQQSAKSANDTPTP